MANTHKLIAIAAAPGRRDKSATPGTDGISLAPVASHTCQTCARRKVKCDKTLPTCSTCSKAKLECLYQTLQPRAKKRKANEDDNQKLARYEQVLREHGLLEKAPSPQLIDTDQQHLWAGSEDPDTGKLVTGSGKSKFVSSGIWSNLANDQLQHTLQDDDDEGEEENVFPQAEYDALPTDIPFDAPHDPLTDAFMSSHRNLSQYHPTPANAILLWETHVENVEPICKILHIPATSEMVNRACQRPEMATKAEVCLLFTVYHFAVFSMTDDQCLSALKEPRSTLMSRYHFAARQALVNASFLKTADMSVLQALVLFLLSCRYFYDSHTYWILTGVAFRIAQRMGIHRDGEKMGLPPFGVQMRRRLFYQLLPLDGIASQMSGTGIAGVPGTWDTQEPQNVNDGQIWPGMNEKPKDQHGATGMIFFLSRLFVAKSVMMASKRSDSTDWNSKEFKEAEACISMVESEVEERYIRFCDMVNPLHFLTIGLARSGINAMRIQIRLPRIKNGMATNAERKEIFELAAKIMDTDAISFSHAGLRKYFWHMKPFFLFGTWDSLIFVLNSLGSKEDLLLPSEIDTVWNRIEQLFDHHNELVESKRPLYVAFRRLTLAAWKVHPPGRTNPEPNFIASLRALRTAKKPSQVNYQEHAQALLAEPKVEASPQDFVDAMLNDFANEGSLDMDIEFNFDDWIMWDRLTRNPQA